MPNRNGDREDWFTGLAIACFVLVVLAFMAWDQALNFDPCNNIFKPPAQPCVTSALEPVIVGALVALLGAAFVHGALTRGPHMLVSRMQVWMAAACGLCVFLMGAALVFAVLTTDLPSP